MLSAPESFSWRLPGFPMTSSLPASIRRVRSSASGGSASLWPACRGSRGNPEAGGKPAFPPSLVVQVKALACELPHRLGLPLSRFSVEDIRQQVLAQGLIAQISGTTIWRWLSQDALCPWRHRTWIFPRDPRFLQKAGPILDLYQGLWEDQPLGSHDFVLSADEKTSIQARARIHASQAARPGHAMKVEHEYERRGAWAYLAAWDVHRAKVFGRCEAQSGIAPFDRLVEQVMEQPPYKSARRVFWIVDNGSSHRGQTAATRLQTRYANLTLVHGPVHASWLNQIEIYFSILQQKVLTPNEFPSLVAVAERLRQFERHYEQIAQPFQWRFTRRNLNQWLEKLAHQNCQQSALAA